MVLAASTASLFPDPSSWGKLIEAASASSLTLVALIVLVVGALAYAFFPKETGPIKLIALGICAVMFAALALAIIYKVANSSNPPPKPSPSASPSSSASRSKSIVDLSLIPCNRYNNSAGVGPKIELDVVNESRHTKQIALLKSDGSLKVYADLKPGKLLPLSSYSDAVWQVSDDGGRCLGQFRVEDADFQRITIK